jgi:CheY-like chemotaxis protein
VVLTDLNMPDITEIELTRSIRKRHTKEDLPIIMVTTQNEAKDNQAALEAGITAIMHKPFTETQIGQALAKHAGFTPGN